MLEWVGAHDLGSVINEAHYEQDAAPAKVGISHSILFGLWPAKDHGHNFSTWLALDAFKAFKGLVGRYGAFHGSFEIWEDGQLKAISRISIIEWPPGRTMEQY